MWDSYDSIKDLHDYLKELIRSSLDVKSAFVQLIDYCENKWLHKHWQFFRGIEVEDDLAQLRQWLREVLVTEPPPQYVKAFWFGIFNPVRAGGLASCDFYIMGSSEFDPKDESSDWACWSSDSYLPEGRYANSQVLATIYSLSLLGSDSDSQQRTEYVLCLGYTYLAVKEIWQDPPRPIAVGFDSGDFLLL